VITAATEFVLPAVPYLQSIWHDKDALVQVLGVSFTVSTLALAADLASHRTLRLSVAGASLVALIPALLGMALGQRLRAKGEQETFRKIFLAALFLLGLHLMISEFL